MLVRTLWMVVVASGILLAGTSPARAASVDVTYDLTGAGIQLGVGDSFTAGGTMTLRYQGAGTAVADGPVVLQTLLLNFLFVHTHATGEIQTDGRIADPRLSLTGVPLPGGPATGTLQSGSLALGSHVFEVATTYFCTFGNVSGCGQGSRFADTGSYGPFQIQVAPGAGSLNFSITSLPAGGTRILRVTGTEVSRTAAPEPEVGWLILAATAGARLASRRRRRKSARAAE